MCPKLAGVTFMAVLLVVFVNVDIVYGSATEQQMWATCKLIRDVCLPKYRSVTTDMANRIRGGNIPDHDEAKCYMHCVLEMMQMMKRGKFVVEAALKQVDLLMPNDYKDDYRVGLLSCKDVTADVNDRCEAAYVLMLCLRAHIEYFVFP